MRRTASLILAMIVFIPILLTGCSSEKSSVPEVNTSDYYDYLLCSGDGYSVVAKLQETVTSSKECIGVLDENYNWVIPLSNNTPFHLNGKLYDSNYAVGSFEDRCKAEAGDIHYAGNGVFIWDVRYGLHQITSWNILKNTSDTTQSADTWSFKLQNGYIIMTYEGKDDECVLIMDENGNFIKTDILCKSTAYVGQYSEGLFYSYKGFYDIDGNLVINLSKYKGLIKNNPCFNNGECRLVAENENGTEFVATIGLDGNFISEFTKV